MLQKLNDCLKLLYKKKWHNIPGSLQFPNHRLSMVTIAATSRPFGIEPTNLRIKMINNTKTDLSSKMMIIWLTREWSKIDCLIIARSKEKLFNYRLSRCRLIRKELFSNLLLRMITSLWNGESWLFPNKTFLNKFPNIGTAHFPPPPPQIHLGSSEKWSQIYIPPPREPPAMIISSSIWEIRSL